MNEFLTALKIAGMLLDETAVAQIAANPWKTSFAVFRHIYDVTVSVNQTGVTGIPIQDTGTALGEIGFAMLTAIEGGAGKVGLTVADVTFTVAVNRVS